MYIYNQFSFFRIFSKMPLKYAILGFFEKNLKPKKAYLGGFWDKNPKKENWF